MREILVDIREKLGRQCYQNEEHVRLCLVARILQSLGWDIWNPQSHFFRGTALGVPREGSA